jgi:catechol 2,3-dioxygenase-like lactoylglutathione lyase family enzyme
MVSITQKMRASAAEWRRSPSKMHRILRIYRVVSDLTRAESFYRDAVGFRTVASGYADTELLAAFGLRDSGAEERVMRLGRQDIALIRFAMPGQPYPYDSRSDDLWFQHAAIVVRDMQAAYAHLCVTPEWHPITEGGPQLLPPSSGAVRAFKFRDPDGHPLELLWFPPGRGRPVWHDAASNSPFLGIDHSALTIASTRRSLHFYRALGFHVSERSINRGPAQERLDGLPNVKVRVAALRPASGCGPGLELLAYSPAGRAPETTSARDGITDWLTLGTGPVRGNSFRAVRDPDGHRLVLVDQGGGAIGMPVRRPMT